MLYNALDIGTRVGNEEYLIFTHNLPIHVNLTHTFTSICFIYLKKHTISLKTCWMFCFVFICVLTGWLTDCLHQFYTNCLCLFVDVIVIFIVVIVVVIVYYYYSKFGVLVLLLFFFFLFCCCCLFFMQTCKVEGK